MKLGIIAIFAALAVMVTMLAACGAEENTSSLLLESGSPETLAPSSSAAEEAGGAGEVVAGSQTLTTNSGIEIALSDLKHYTDSEDAPVVYYISDITPEAMMAVYEALGWTPEGNVAVKISTGEPGSNYLDPELIATQPTAVPAPPPPCTIRWPRITVLPLSLMCRSKTRLVP